MHKTYESYTTIVVEIRDSERRLKCILSVVLNRDLVDIVIDHSLPQSELIDNATVDIEVISDPVVINELLIIHKFSAFGNCACCTSGIGITGEYNSNCHGSLSRYRTPLSPKMVAALMQNGHAFVHDPRIAQRAEQEAWRQLRVQQVNAMWD